MIYGRDKMKSKLWIFKAYLSGKLITCYHVYAPNRRFARWNASTLLRSNGLDFDKLTVSIGREVE